MAEELIKGVSKAFNGGNIEPTGSYSYVFIRLMADELMSLCVSASYSELQRTNDLEPPSPRICRSKSNSQSAFVNFNVLRLTRYRMQYELMDGTIIGDPLNVALTKEIVELGWKPPRQRGRWDLLPIVTMADGDAPVINELPPDLRKLVQIRHPRYETEFDNLGLKWVLFPALTRLGFDIGGVQYTATPFVGWYVVLKWSFMSIS